MKSLRSGIGSRRDSADGATAVLADDSEEPFVQVSTQPTASIAGVNADKVDVGLFRPGLRQKANEESSEPVLVEHNEARICEVLKE